MCDATKETMEQAERISGHNPYECPVCNEVDEDGLEACDGCYNSVIGEAAKQRERANVLQDELADAKQIIVLLKHQATRAAAVHTPTV